MYAKLKFIAGTENRIVNRSIVQLITKAYVTGYDGNFDGIAGIDSGGSKVYNTDSSHWNFVNGSTDLLSTYANHDSAFYDADQAYHGTEYILQNSTGQAGHKKTVSVRMWGLKTNAGVYGATDGGGTHIFPIHHFGKSGVENYTLGNTTDTSATYTNHGGISIFKDKHIHIFADRYKLCLVGKTGEDTAGHLLNGVFEFPRSSSMKYRDTLNTIADSNAPYYWIMQGYGTNYTNFEQYGIHPGSVAWRHQRWSDIFGSNHGGFVHFPGGIYNERTGSKLRSTGFSLANATTANNFYAYADDDTTQSITTQSLVDKFSSNYVPSTHIPGYSMIEWGGPFPSVDQEFGDAISGGFSVDSTGQRTMTLDPIIMNWQPYQGDTVNMSELSGHYHASGNLGFFGDSATINGETYQYFPFTQNRAIVLKSS